MRNEIVEEMRKLRLKYYPNIVIDNFSKKDREQYSRLEEELAKSCADSKELTIAKRELEYSTRSSEIPYLTDYDDEYDLGYKFSRTLELAIIASDAEAIAINNDDWKKALLCAEIRDEADRNFSRHYWGENYKKELDNYRREHYHDLHKEIVDDRFDILRNIAYQNSNEIRHYRQQFLEICKICDTPENLDEKKNFLDAMLYAKIREEKMMEEEKARREREEKARREAEEKAQEEAKREAEEKAWIEAREKAWREAQEKAEKEAEEKAKREAEKKAKIEAQEKAEKEAEEEAKRIVAEERAKERAKIAAEEMARWEAEKLEIMIGERKITAGKDIENNARLVKSLAEKINSIYLGICESEKSDKNLRALLGLSKNKYGYIETSLGNIEKVLNTEDFLSNARMILNDLSTSDDLAVLNADSSKIKTMTFQYASLNGPISSLTSRASDYSDVLNDELENDVINRIKELIDNSKISELDSKIDEEKREKISFLGRLQGKDKLRDEKVRNLTIQKKQIEMGKKSPSYSESIEESLAELKVYCTKELNGEMPDDIKTFYENLKEARTMGLSVDDELVEKNVHEKELNEQKLVEKKPENSFFKYRREAKKLRERNDMIDPTVPDVPISSKMFSDVNTERMFIDSNAYETRSNILEQIHNISHQTSKYFEKEHGEQQHDNYNFDER